MRTREQLREHCERLYIETDVHKRAFKLFMIDVELQLDQRDLLEIIAQKLAPEEYAALKSKVHGKSQTKN